MRRAGKTAMIGVVFDRAQLRWIAKAMKKLEPNLIRRAVRPAASKAMTPVRKSARAKVAKRSGALRKSLGRKTKTYSRLHLVMVFVGPRVGFRDPATGEDPVNIAHLVEFGTAPHQIPPPPGGFKIGQTVFHGTIMHPGARPHPFLRPALDENKGRVIAIFRREVLRRLQVEIKRARAG